MIVSGVHVHVHVHVVHVHERSVVHVRVHVYCACVARSSWHALIDQSICNSGASILLKVLGKVTNYFSCG